MKIILVLLDGLGDRAYEDLAHQTPLQSATTPNLNRLARLGSTGLYHASRPGQCLPSEAAHHLLFGYDMSNFPGRGLLEAVGEGVPFADDDVLCLTHISGIIWEKDLPILGCGRDDITGTTEEIGALFEALTPYEADGITFTLHQTRRNDAILVMSGSASPFVSDSDPIVIGRPMARILPLSDNPEPERAAKTASALNAYLSHCHNVLTGIDVNFLRKERGLPAGDFLATQRCGRRIPQQSFKKRWGMSAMMIASGSVYGGLAHELGLDFVRVRDGNNPGDDLRERIRLALSDSAHDFIHVHTKAPDEAAHKGTPKTKEVAITALDQGLDELVDAVERGDDLVVAVTADHSTPSRSPLIHSGEPVPVVLVGRSVRRDDVTSFDEMATAKGCLGFLKGRELMLMLLNYGDRSVLVGHQLGDRKAPHVPKDYKPFRLD